MSNPIADAVERDLAAIRGHLHHPHYHATSTTTTPPEAAMPLPIIATIEQDLTAAGHTVDGALHDVLSRHLTIGNLAAHVGQWAATAEASPILQAVEKFALGPAGEATVARIVEEVASLAAAQATPNMQAGGEPAPVQ